jgi:hypothetical protein
MTLQKVEFLLQNTPRELKLQFGDERKALLRQIRERLEDPTGRRMNEHDLETKMTAYSFLDRMALRAKLAEIIERQELSALPVEQVKAALAATRAKEAEPNTPYEDAHGNHFPKLLDKVQLAGKTGEVLDTATYLKGLLRGRDPEKTFQLRNMMKRYGSEQINRYLAA